MPGNVICVSRSLGAGGEELGRAVAHALDFRYADEEIIIKAAEKAGVSPETVAQAEHSPSLIARILEGIGRTPIATEGWSPGAMALSPPPEDYVELIRKVVHETAAQGNVVIVAHGASLPLASMPGVLRVFVTGSAEVRADRLAREGNLNRREARKAITESDRQRSDYLRRFYGVRQELPAHYDLVVNTDRMTPVQAAPAVLAAAGALA